MIIDQLPVLGGDVQSTDEIPVERGTTTYKTTPAKFLAVLPKDSTPTQGSSNVVTSGGVYTALATKQDKITANGILKGNGSGSITAAEKGVDFGGAAFQVTLLAADWSGNAQTVSDSRFVAVGFAYVITPAVASLADYASAQIYADDITVAGQATFHCGTAPETDLTVSVLRVVSA